MSWLEIENKKLYVEKYGDPQAKPLLYLHGGPGASCLDFVEQAQLLSEEFYVISFDQYGVLRSDSVIEDTFGMHDHIQLIEKMREALGIEKWSIMGHSYGGSLACLYANKVPERIEKTVYVCPSWSIGDSVKGLSKMVESYFVEIDDSEGEKLCQVALNKQYEVGAMEPFHDMIQILARIKDQKVRNYLHRISHKEYSRFFDHDNYTDDMWEKGNKHFNLIGDEGCIANNWLPILAANKQPALLVCGKYDPVCEENQQKYFRENVENGTFICFEESGHFPHIEQAAQFSQVVRKFLME